MSIIFYTFILHYIDLDFIIWSIIFYSNLTLTLEAQKQDLAEKDQKLKDQDKKVAELQNELNQEKDKFNGEWGATIFWYSQ